MSSKTGANTSASPKLGKLIAALVVILAIVLYWAVDIEWRDISTNVGFDSDARKNPYLAAQLFIEKSNSASEDSTTVVESQRGFALVDNPPTTDDAIIITSARYSMSKRRTETLIQWLNDGGQLIVTGKMLFNNENQSSGDGLLDHFGIEVFEADVSEDENQTDSGDENSEQPSSPKADKSTEKDPKNQPQTIGEALEQASQNNKISCTDNPLFSPITTSEGFDDANANIASPNILSYADLDQVHFWSSDGYGPQLIQLRVGKGMLTVMTDMRLWSNKQLHCFDNAYLLHQLTRDTQKVWLLFHEDMPGIMTLLWQKNHSLVISLLVLLMFWLWSQTLRFGAPKLVENTVRRQFMEHIEAAASYRWRSGEGDQLIELLRHQIIQQVAMRHIGLTQMTELQQIELIRGLLETHNTTNKADIHEALYGEIPLKTDHIVLLVQRLQQLRKQLC